MTRRLDPPLRVGGIRLWVLCDRHVAGWALAGGAGFAASKRPLAVVIDDGATIAAFDPGGRALAPEEIETLSPGLADRIAASRGQVPG